MGIGAVALAIPMIASAAKGMADQARGNRLQQQQFELARQQYQERAPLRRQGMQALGQVEAPIDFGTTFQNTSNPFSRSVPSTASYGNWSANTTTAPQQMDLALTGLRPDEIQFAQDALSGSLIGRSGGKQRFSSTSGREYTNDDRNHAMMLQNRITQALGYTGVTPDRFMQQQGIAPLGRLPTPPDRPRIGVQPLGGGR